ncbi:MAG: ABC-type sugar transport system substrate-binding protein, partial [Ilumatobacter sp.]
MTKAKKWLAVPLVGALVLAACGGSDDDAADTTEDTAVEAEAEEVEPEAEEAAPGAEGLAAAQAVVDANLTIPTAIAPTIALDSIPEEKTVAWLECSLPSCIAIGIGFADAAEALGWNLEVISFATDAAPAFQQAIDQGVDYVAITGTAPALIQDQLDQANAAGIPTMSCFDATEPSPDGYAMQCGDATAVALAGDLISNAIIADSGGTAN